MVELPLTNFLEGKTHTHTHTQERLTINVVKARPGKTKPFPRNTGTSAFKSRDCFLPVGAAVPKEFAHNVLLPY